MTAEIPPQEELSPPCQDQHSLPSPPHHSRPPRMFTPDECHTSGSPPSSPGALAAAAAQGRERWTPVPSSPGSPSDKENDRGRGDIREGQPQALLPKVTSFSIADILNSSKFKAPCLLDPSGGCIDKDLGFIAAERGG